MSIFLWDVDRHFALSVASIINIDIKRSLRFFNDVASNLFSIALRQMHINWAVSLLYTCFFFSLSQVLTAWFLITCIQIQIKIVEEDTREIFMQEIKLKAEGIFICSCAMNA